MGQIRNGRLLFNEVPTRYPEPGKTTVYDTSKTIDLENEPLHGGVLVKTLVISVDPYLRGQMRAPTLEAYSPPFYVGEPLYGYGVGKVVRSENSGFKAGDHVYGPALEWAEYSIISHKDLSYVKVIVQPEYTLPWSVYVGAAGMPGQTAYYGWKEHAKAKAGETAFITTGAGTVGSMLIQLAKADGLRVIASAGSEEKVRFCKEIGADIAFNYKTTNIQDILAKEGPIDIFWDNVGGPTLETAIVHSKVHGRVIICGYISGYNTEQAYGVKTLEYVLINRITIQGFSINDLTHWQEEFNSVIPQKLASGEIKYTEDVTRGLERSGEAIAEVQKGLNTGKKIVIVADD